MHHQWECTINGNAPSMGMYRQWECTVNGNAPSMAMKNRKYGNAQKRECTIRGNESSLGMHHRLECTHQWESNTSTGSAPLVGIYHLRECTINVRTITGMNHGETLPHVVVIYLTIFKHITNVYMLYCPLNLASEICLDDTTRRGVWV